MELVKCLIFRLFLNKINFGGWGFGFGGLGFGVWGSGFVFLVCIASKESINSNLLKDSKLCVFKNFYINLHNFIFYVKFYLFLVANLRLP